MSKKHQSIARKLTRFFIVMTIIITIVLLLLSYLILNDIMQNQTGERALSMAEVLSSAITGEDFDSILASGEKNDVWYDFKELVDETKHKSGVKYIYVFDDEYDDEFTYFAEGYSEASNAEDEFDLLDKEPIETFADELFVTLETGEKTMTKPYDAGEFGILIGGFSAIKDKSGNVVGVVGVDLAVPNTLSDILKHGNIFYIVMAVLIVCLIAFFLIIRYTVNTMVKKPITQISQAAKRLSLGETDIKLDIKSGDEIGELASSFDTMAESSKKQAEVLNKLAGGDLTVDITPRSDNDLISKSIIRLVDDLKIMFGEILISAGKVSGEANNIAASASSLAEASNQQAESILTLKDTARIISGGAGKNLEKTDRSASVADEVREIVKKCDEKMSEMISAVAEMNDAMTEISRVITDIDSIAFQTNILALNASIEAARAGVHGKGFDVVASEVGNLASKSAESAEETTKIINDSIEKTKLSIIIANETAQALGEIIEGIEESTEIAKDIATSSEDQNDSINKINSMIEELTDVVNRNTTLSEESAAASEKMASMSAELEQVIGKYQTS